MQAQSLLMLVGALALAGCGGSDKPGSGATNTSSSVLTAPVDYLDAVGRVKVSAQKHTDIASLSQAIAMFKMDNDRFPKDLDELVTEKFLPRLPDLPYGMKYVYDPQTGKVQVVKK